MDVIFYDMVQTPTMLNIPCAGDLIKEEKHLQYLLRQWRKQLPDQDKFVHLLSHKYETSNFALATLKGKDALVAQRLLKIFSVQGFHLFFGQLNRTAHVLYGGEIDANNSLKHIINPEGLELAKSCPVGVEDEVLDEERLNNTSDVEEEGDDSDSLSTFKRNVSVSLFHYLDVIAANMYTRSRSWCPSIGYPIS